MKKMMVFIGIAIVLAAVGVKLVFFTDGPAEPEKVVTDHRYETELQLRVSLDEASLSSGREQDESLDLKGEPLRIGQWWNMENELTPEEKERQKRVERKYNTKVEYVQVPLDQYQSRFITSSVAGEPFADIVMLEVNWTFPKLVEEGYVQSLDSLIDLRDPKFSANPVTMEHGKFKGKQYGITLPYTESNGLYYNKTMLKEAGAPDPYVLQEKGEWTWSNFLAICKILKQRSQACLADYPVENTTFFIYANNGSVVENNKVMLDSPNTLEAIRLMADMYNVYGFIGPDDIVHRKVGFSYGHRWDAMSYATNKDMKDELGYVFYPKGPKAKDHIVPYQKMNLWFVPKGIKHAKAKLAAWSELYEMDVEKGFQVKLQKETPYFQTAENLDTLRRMFGKIQLINYTSYIGFKELYDEAIQSVMRGKQSAVEAMLRIKSPAQAAIDVTLKK